MRFRRANDFLKYNVVLIFTESPDVIFSVLI